MDPARTALLCVLTTLLAIPVAPAGAASPGGVPAPSSPQSGGSEYGVPVQLVQARPLLAALVVPATLAAGSAPRVSLRIEEPGVATVNVRVTITSLDSHRAVASALLGWVHTRRTLTVGWPASTKLGPGSYQVGVRAHDHHGGQLRVAHSAAQTTITVLAPTPPAPAPPPTEPSVLTPAQSAAAGAVFPVAGPHSFGGPENRFGAPRGSHVHEGQDVLTAEGTPIIAPFAGTIITASYQASGAGYYVAEHTGVGFDFMFAHCEAGTLAVSTAQSVASGQLLCDAGQSGDATTPHLHFEIWVGGWWAPGGQPIDPLPYLEAWERSGAAA